MSFLNADTFIYNKRSSDDYNLLICNFGEPELKTGLSREVVKGETSALRPKANHFGTRYADVLTFTFSVVHKDYSPFTKEELSKILAWLTSSKTPKRFHANDTSTLFTDFYGLFTDVIYQSSSIGVCGLTLTFTCDSVYSYTPTYKQTYICPGEPIEIKVYNESDELEEYTFPIVSIYSKENQIINIKNISDDSKVLSITAKENCSYIFNNEQMSIYDQDYNLLNFSELGLDKILTTGDFYIYWIRLLPGENKLKITGNCSITFEATYRRKVGNI